ncbi:hypothetical protein PIB30_056031 [Stylosanthes scabra]|uniref:Uncharacterized protein n=1 Tax=Stylosanthes scabra TaxID=79078 RepID=A0ABU6VL09_9FABA|nr:hypothetical protein [Stylosanthes scabra]
MAKKGKALKHAKTHTKKKSKPENDEGHEFRCVPKSVAIIFKYLDENSDKRALVEEMGFGPLSNLPNYYLKQKVLKKFINRYDIYDNTIRSVAGEVEITTQKIWNALGLSSIGIYKIFFMLHKKSGSDFDFKSGSVLLGKPFGEKVITKDLDEEDKAAHKFFQGKTQVALSNLIMNTPVDTHENKRLFMRAFVLFIQKCFLLATSSANITPRALLTIFDVENTKERTGHFMCITSSMRS